MHGSCVKNQTAENGFARFRSPLCVAFYINKTVFKANTTGRVVLRGP